MYSLTHEKETVSEKCQHLFNMALTFHITSIVIKNIIAVIKLHHKSNSDLMIFVALELLCFIFMFYFKVCFIIKIHLRVVLLVSATIAHN